MPCAHQQPDLFGHARWLADRATQPNRERADGYDGEGNRVALIVNGGAPTYYLDQLEEVTGSTVTKYFTADSSGLPTAERVGTGGAISYLAGDGLGSVDETLDGTGAVTFQQLYTPYGSGRYTVGTSPTTKGFTGQRTDKQSGLDYYGARYYDASVGQFTSADTVQDGFNRFAYVLDNPTSLIDPTGHIASCDEIAHGCGDDGGGVLGEGDRDPLEIGAGAEASNEGVGTGENVDPPPTAGNYHDNWENELPSEPETAGPGSGKASTSSNGTGGGTTSGTPTTPSTPTPPTEPASTTEPPTTSGHGPYTQPTLPGMEPESASEGAPESSNDPVARRVTLRQDTIQKILDAQARTSDGDFIDQNSGAVIPQDGPYDIGHRPGFEWWRTQQIARAEGWTRQQVIEYENDPTHYWIEDPGSNRSHRYEQP